MEPSGETAAADAERCTAGKISKSWTNGAMGAPSASRKMRTLPLMSSNSAVVGESESNSLLMVSAQVAEMMVIASASRT